MDNYMLLLRIQNISDQFIYSVNSIAQQLRTIHNLQSTIISYNFMQTINRLSQIFQSLFINLHQFRIHRNIYKMPFNIFLFIRIGEFLYILIMGAICCPPALEPPTPLHLRSRRILQGLAIGLLPVAGLAIAAADQGYVFQFFICLFLLFFLFLSWRTFNWCSVLIFLIYALINLFQASINLAGYIQYSQIFAKKYVVASIFLIVSILYNSIAIFLSHYAYRVFKSDSLNPLFQVPQPPANDDQNQRLVDRGRVENRQNNQNNNANNNYFAGAGVRIG